VTAGEFENRAVLVSAEIARIEGRILIRAALRAGYPLGTANGSSTMSGCNEVAARFYAGMGSSRSPPYLESPALLSQLGRHGKVRQLDDHPHLREDQPWRVR